MDPYRYALELIAEDGRTLGQVLVEPDWEPALECAAFRAVRRGRLPATSNAARGSVEPLWDERRGEPAVGGFRVRLDAAEVDPPMELPVAYLSPQARAASAAFVESGALRTGESFAYRVHAFATTPDGARGDGGGAVEPAFAVDEIATPLPIDEAPLAAFLERAVRWGPAAEPDEFPVFVPRSVLEETMERAQAHPDVEIGGILVGRLLRDPTQPELFLEVTAQIAARHAVSAATTLTFTADTWAAAAAAIALRRREELLCGWYHSHINWCRHCPVENQLRCTRSNAFFSPEDVHLHRVCFASAHAVALQTTDNIHTGMTWSLYGWSRGAVIGRGFHIIE